MRDMASYFLDFTPAPGNLYFELVERLEGMGERVALATLNYDLLLDAALSVRWRALWIGEPAELDGAPCLLKPHGAPNLIPDTEHVFIGGTVIGCPAILDAPSKISAPNEVISWLEVQDVRDNQLAPVMSLYARDKNSLWCSDRVMESRTHFAEMARTVQNIIVCGVRHVDHDGHIWKPLHESAAKLIYIAYDDASAAEIRPWAASRQAHTAVEHGDFRTLIRRLPEFVDAEGVSTAATGLIEGQTLHPWDLPIDSDLTIIEREFLRCDFRGPGMITFGGCRIERCAFERDAVESAIAVPDGHRVVGGYMFQQCRFRECTFAGVRLAGTAGQLAGLGQLSSQ